MSADPARGPRLPKPPQRPRIRWTWWVAWAVGLLVLNYWVASRATQAPPRVRVPYSPFFLAAGAAPATSRRSRRRAPRSRGRSRVAESYAGSKKTTRFQTEIPAFADTNALSRCSREEGGRQRAAARHGHAVVGEPAARLRADAPLHRAASSARCAAPGACRACSARSAARAHGATSRAATTRHLRRRRRHRRGEGRS